MEKKYGKHRSMEKQKYGISTVFLRQKYGKKIYGKMGKHTSTTKQIAPFFGIQQMS
jgi:hypothetical protein